MRDPALFVRSYDRPLPASMLWLGAVALCVDGRVDWPTLAFHCVASEDPARVGFGVCSRQAFNDRQPLERSAPAHTNLGSMPPKGFTGYVYLGAWTLSQLRSVLVRAAVAKDASSPRGLIESAVLSMKGACSPWLAMSRVDGESIDRVVQARDAAHAAKMALALPGTLEGMLSVAELSGHVQRLEEGANAAPHSDAALPFYHRVAGEGEIELQEFIANHRRSDEALSFVEAALSGRPLPPLGGQ